jgi:uncharacterized protein
VSTRLVPVPSAPALLLESDRRVAPKWMVVSDVHLGLGASRERPAGPVEGSGIVLAEELVRLVRGQRADGVVVAGDAKHPIVGTPRALRSVIFDFFARLLEEGIRVELVLGNHDVGIVPHLPREVDVHTAAGVVREGVGIFHGHRWPSPEVLQASRLVAGHLHPGYRFAPTAEDPLGKRRCWVRVEVASPPNRRAGRAESPRPSAREIVVLPAFNPIAGTESLNRERPARGRTFLYKRFLSLGPARAYLLDGTDLGLLPIPSPSVPPRPRSRAGPPAR